MLYYFFCAFALCILAGFILNDVDDETGDECESDDWNFDIEEDDDDA